MTYAFTVSYLPQMGDGNLINKTVFIEAENETDAYDYAIDKYSSDPECLRVVPFEEPMPEEY